MHDYDADEFITQINERIEYLSFPDDVKKTMKLLRLLEGVPADFRGQVEAKYTPPNASIADNTDFDEIATWYRNQSIIILCTTNSFNTICNDITAY